MLETEVMYQELEDEFESDLDGEFAEELEDEFEDEGFFGLGEEEYEIGDEREEFFSKKRRNIFRRFARKLAPVLKRVAPIAARVVGKAIAGPAGGRIAGMLVREGEFEDEMEDEFLGEYENDLDGETEYGLDGELEEEYELEDLNGEYESELEAEDELELAMADILADAASKVRSELEAEAYVGAAAAKVIPKKAPVAVKKMTPKIVKASANLSKLLRKSKTTRPLVKTIPLIARLSAKKLATQAKRKRLTAPVAAKIMAMETKKVLGNPMVCSKTLIKSSQQTRKLGKKLAKVGK